MNTKTMLAISALCAAMAVNAEVTSQNTVGYQSYTLDSGAGEFMHNIGIQFDNIGADSSFVISNAIFGTALQDGDAIMIFNPEFYNYDYYTYLDTDGQGTMGFQVDFGDGENVAFVYSITVSKGDNILFMPANYNDVNVSGQVTASGSTTLSFDMSSGDFCFPLANPYPIATKMSDMTMLQDGDAIMIFNPEFYNYDYYSYLDTDGQGTMGFQVDLGDGENVVFITDPDTVILEAGQGGLYLPADSREWTVTFVY